MENLLGHIESVVKEGAIYSPLGETRVSMVSVEDIADVAAAILLDGGHIGKTYVLTGPEALNYSEIAGVLGDILGKPVKYVHVPYETAKARMIKAGTPKWLAADAIMQMQSWGQGKGSMVSSYVERLTGRKPVSVQEFFMKHKSGFLAAA